MATWSLPILIAIFAAAAAAVWMAGARLAHYAREVADRTGVAQALIGMLLLGGITSLPEVATTLTASLRGEAVLAVNNLVGGISLQVALLGVADIAIGRTALSSVIAKPVVLLQGVLCVLLLTLLAIAIGTGDVALGPFGAWTTAIAVAFVASVWLIRRAEKSPGWEVQGGQGRAGAGEGRAEGGRGGGSGSGVGGLVWRIGVVALVVLVGGFLLARTGEVLAERSGLGSNFFGAILLGSATSLPEVSTVLTAARNGGAALAFGDIFGTNLFDVALLFLVDAAYSGGPALNQVGVFSQVAALLGVVLTAVFLAGLIERRNWSIARAGPDSIVALLAYAGGVVLLYTLR